MNCSDTLMRQREEKKSHKVVFRRAENSIPVGQKRQNFLF